MQGCKKHLLFNAFFWEDAVSSFPPSPLLLSECSLPSRPSFAAISSFEKWSGVETQCESKMERRVERERRRGSLNNVAKNIQR